MNREGILDYAKLLVLGPLDRSSNKRFLNFKCPFAPYKHSNRRDSTASFGIRIKNHGHSHYWCFGCHSRGFLPQLAYELGRLRQTDYTDIGHEIETAELIGPRPRFANWESPKVHTVDLDDEEAEAIVWPESGEEFSYYSAAGHPYLHGRGIDPLTAAAIGLRFDPYQRRILFPVHSPEGRFGGFSGRAIDGPAGVNTDGDKIDKDGRIYLRVKDYFGLRKSQFLLGSHRARSGRTPAISGFTWRSTCSNTRPVKVVLSEGLFDYAAIAQLGVHGLTEGCRSGAILGSWLTTAQLKILIQLDMPTVLFFDNDGPGRDARDHAVSQLFGKLPLLDVAYPDEYDGADPASLPMRLRAEMINNAQLIVRPTP